MIKAVPALVAVLLLLAVAWVAPVIGATWLIAVAVPYAAFVLFVCGFVLKVVSWARAPVPFRITTTCGQQKSLDFLPHARLENPFTGWQAALRVLEEVVLFRSLFRNVRMRWTRRRDLVYESSRWLWLAGLAFHASLLLIILRHLRFFLDPVPALVLWLGRLDGLFQLAVPTILVSDIVIVAALAFLLARRLVDARLRYLSLPADYFALFLLLGIVLSGVSMRHLTRVDLVAVKELAVGLATLAPRVPDGIGTPFLLHVLLVSTLFAVLPLSKLMHIAGAVMSPTRNLANNSRARRHESPWNPEVEVHTYEQWEDEFRDKLVAAGLPVEGKQT